MAVMLPPRCEATKSCYGIPCANAIAAVAAEGCVASAHGTRCGVRSQGQRRSCRVVAAMTAEADIVSRATHDMSSRPVMPVSECRYENTLVFRPYGCQWTSTGIEPSDASPDGAIERRLAWYRNSFGGRPWSAGTCHRFPLRRSRFSCSDPLSSCLGRRRKKEGGCATK